MGSHDKKWLEIIDQVEIDMRNRLVLPKAVLEELERIYEKNQHALEAIEKLLYEDLPKLRKKLMDELK